MADKAHDTVSATSRDTEVSASSKQAESTPETDTAVAGDDVTVDAADGDVRVSELKAEVSPSSTPLSSSASSSPRAGASKTVASLTPTSSPKPSPRRSKLTGAQQQRRSATSASPRRGGNATSPAPVAIVKTGSDQIDTRASSKTDSGISGEAKQAAVESRLQSRSSPSRALLRRSQSETPDGKFRCARLFSCLFYDIALPIGSLV